MPKRLIVEKNKIQENADLLDEYAEFLLIDKHNLDTALVEQGSVYYNVGIAYANAISARDYAKAELDKAKADADKVIRQTALTENERLTEAQVANRILEDTLYRAAHDEYLEWKLIADKWLALKESFEQRSYSLKELCQLWASNYYADTSVQSERHEAVDRVAAEARVAEAEIRKLRRAQPSWNSGER